MAAPVSWPDDVRGAASDGAEFGHLVMPLGGLGTGNLAICADGGLRQWQLHNIGNHAGALPGSFFSYGTTCVAGSATSLTRTGCSPTATMWGCWRVPGRKGADLRCRPGTRTRCGLARSTRWPHIAGASACTTRGAQCWTQCGHATTGGGAT